MHSELHLKLVNIFHRHGERSPLNLHNKPLGRINACNKSNTYIESLPKRNLSFFTSLFTNKLNMPLSFELIYFKDKNGECAPGQLTDYGKMNLYNLGNKFRQDYIHTNFISKVFDKDVIHLVSTDFQRTIESLQSLIKGMFKDANDVIPINLGKKGIKSLYTSKFCDKYLLERKNHMKMVSEKYESNVKQIYAYVRAKYPVLEKLKGVYSIFDVVMSSNANNYSYFKNFSPKILNLAEKFAVETFFGHLEKKTNLAINRGQIIKDLHDRIKNVAYNGMYKTKMYILSGHDTTIYPLLMAFNIHDGKWPNFGANIVVETYEAPDKKHYVKVKYNGQVKELPMCRKHYKKDRKYCLVDEFLRICEECTVKDRDSLCK